MITLHQLKLFVSVAQSLSMTQASREFHVSQPAVSHQIKKLEHELGKPLFRRYGRGIELTNTGSALLRECSVILSKVEDLLRDSVNVAPSQRDGKASQRGVSFPKIGRAKRYE